MADWENPSEWFGGRLAIGRDLLKRLNATASQVEKEEMGIRVRPPSWQLRLSVMYTLPEKCSLGVSRRRGVPQSADGLVLSWCRTRRTVRWTRHTTTRGPVWTWAQGRDKAGRQYTAASPGHKRRAGYRKYEG
jgi:hypothetical protein